MTRAKRATSVPSKQQVTRVGVEDETWRAFRHLALDRGLSVATYLATLVEAERRRRHVRPPVAVAEGATEADRAIAALTAVRSSIDQLDAIATRSRRHGAWRFVAGRRQFAAARRRGGAQGVWERRYVKAPASSSAGM